MSAPSVFADVPEDFAGPGILGMPLDEDFQPLTNGVTSLFPSAGTPQCAPRNDYTPLEYGAAKQRDPVDAERQLEVLAQLFREGRMPREGVDILEGVASRCSYRRVGEDLGLSKAAVRGRMDTMRKIFRQRMVELGVLPSMQPLRLIVCRPKAIETLRMAA